MTDRSYETTLHAVDDLGASADGEAALRLGADAIGPNTDVVLPDGEFAFVGRAAIGEGSLRFRAADGASPVLRAPSEYNGFVVDANCEHFAFEGIDVDVSDGVTGFRVKTDSFDVSNVEFRGRGTHPDGSVTPCFSLAVTDPAGEGTISDVTALKGSTWARYKNGDGRGFAWVGSDHVGTLRLRNCRVSEFGNNGVYGSAAEGRIVVEDSEFWNNNVASLRFGSDGCAIRNTVVGIDADRYTGPREPRFEREDFFLRGVWVEAKRGALDRPGRVAIDESTVVVRDAPTAVRPVLVRPNAGALSVSRTTIDVQGDVGAAPIGASRPGATGPDYRRHPKPDPPYDVALDTVRLCGSGSADAAVGVTGRDVAARRVFVAFDDDRDGFRVADGDCTLMDCHVSVGGDPAVVTTTAGGDSSPGGSRLTQRNVSTRTDAATWRGLLSDRAALFAPERSRIAVGTDGDRTVTYELVATTGSAIDAADGAVDPTAAGGTVSGTVEPTERVTHRLDGALAWASFSAGARVTLDGERVDPDALAAETRRRETDHLRESFERLPTLR